MMIITSILGMLRNGFVLSKTVIFIFGLVSSNAFVNSGVVHIFADFLGDNNYDLWKATMLVNFLDVLSAVLKLAVIHVSEAYTGRFLATIFSTAAFTMGLVLLYASASAPDMVTLVCAIVLIALGKAGEEPTLGEFFDYQLSEVKKNSTQRNEGEDKESLEEEKEILDRHDSGTTNLWWSTASIFGSVIANLFLGLAPNWSEKFKLSSIIMGATCLLFIIGWFWYYPEGKPSGSPLTTIYRVFLAAMKKRKLSYPSSEQGYNNEDSDDLLEGDLFYQTENGEVHLLPRHPSFLSFLDRAAMTNSDDVCTVVQVRDVKNLYLIIPLGITFFAYSLVSASGNTYFVLQTTNLTSYSIGGLDVSIMVFFAIKSLVNSVVRTIQSRYKVVTPLWSMAVGMFCSVLCCIAAWQVESHRLPLIKSLENPDDGIIPMSIMILTPQYFLLGLMKGFAESGLETLLSDRLYSESMKKFVEPCIEMLLGIGKLSSILFALIFHMWIKDHINDSHLDRYFLVLASLSFAYLMIYVLYAKFKFQKPQSVAPSETIQETFESMDEKVRVRVDINQ